MLVVLLALCSHGRLRAQARDPVELTWHAPPGCPSADDVQARVRELLGAAQLTGTRPRAEATIARSAGGRLQLTLIVRAGDLIGQRQLEGDACDDLAGAAAVDVVLLLHSASPPSAAELEPRGHAKERRTGARTRAAESSTARAEATPRATPTAAQPETAASAPPPPAPAAAAQPEPAPARPSSEPAPSERSWRGLIQLPLAASALGPMPRASFGVGLAAGVALERWRVLARAQLFLPQDLPTSAAAGAGARLDLLDAGLWLCRGFAVDRLELAPCVNVSLEHMWARGTGIHVAARTAQSTWVAAGLGGQVRFALGERLGLVAGVDAQIGTARPRISVEGFGRIGQLGPAAVRITLGAEWIL